MGEKEVVQFQKWRETLQEQFQHKIIGLDSMVFIYHFEEHPHYSPLTLALFHLIETGVFQAVTSVLTLMELLVHPKAHQRKRLVKEYKRLLLEFPHLKLVPVNVEIAEEASQLRADYRISPADALHLSTSRLESASFYLTNDFSLKNISSPKVVLLDQLMRES